jgi:exodeoxyribonuclease VII large subunit
LSRGFVRVTDRDGKTLTKAEEARAARLLTLHFADGAVEAATGEPTAGARRVERPPERSYVAPPQRSLFDSPEE